MFFAAYIVILSLSAAFGAWIMSVGSQRAARVLNQSPRLSHGGAALLSAIGFLVVVAAPAGVILGALAVMATGYFAPRDLHPHLLRFGTPVLAVALGMLGLHFMPLLGLPIFAIAGIAAIIWLLITFSGELLPENYTPSALATAVALLPLAGASFFNAPSWVAVDATLILAALVGAALAHADAPRMGFTRIAFAFLVGWLLVVTLMHGAWVPAILSIAFWLAALGYAYYEDPDRKNYAFEF